MTFTRFLRWQAVWLAALLLFLLALGSAPAPAADGETPGSTSSPTTPDADGADGADGASPSVKFGLGPARAVSDGELVDGRAYLNYSATPGATLSDKVALINYSATPLVLEVYATDAFQAEDGGFSLLPGGDEPADAGSWITLDVPATRKVRIPPRVGDTYGLRYIPLEASIPADATPGDHVGGVIASLSVTSTNDQGAQVTLDQRIGLRTYFQISGDLEPQLMIEDLKASYTDERDPLGRGDITVSYTVHNTGNIRLNATQDVSVDRWVAGGIAGTPPPIEDILPGSRIRVTQAFDNRFGLGRLEAAVALHPTPVDPLYTQAIPDATASKTFWAWPWVLLAIIAGILLLLLGLYLRHRRRKRRRMVVAASADQVPADDRELVGASSSRSTRPRGGRRRASEGAGLLVAGLVAALVGLSPLVWAIPAAHAEPPKGSVGEVMLETNDATGVPANALLQGVWGHEGGAEQDNPGPTFFSLNLADKTGAVTDASLAAVHEAMKDGGTFENLRVAFVPYSADGSNERPRVSPGDTVADVYPWFADLGMGSSIVATPPTDFVATVSTGPEFIKWWDAGRPLQGYTDDLGVVDIADDSSTRPAAAPQGRSILDRWPAGKKISLVLYQSDGVDASRPGLPTVAVGADGRAVSSWLTFKTVADPAHPDRGSAGYEVLTGGGTGPEAPIPPGGLDNAVTAGSGNSGGADDPGSGTGGGAADGGGGAESAAPGDESAAPGAESAGPVGTTGDETLVDGDEGTENAVISAVPGGAPTFWILLALLALGGAAWATWWLRTGRTGSGSAGPKASRS